MTNIDPAIVEALTEARMREHFGTRLDEIRTDSAYTESLTSYRRLYRARANDALPAIAPLVADAVKVARAGAWDRTVAERFLGEWRRPYFGPDANDAVAAVLRAVRAALDVTP